MRGSIHKKDQGINYTEIMVDDKPVRLKFDIVDLGFLKLLFGIVKSRPGTQDH